MTGIRRLRHTLSSLILWCVFLCLYAGGTAILALGLIFIWKTWWTLMHQQAGMWSKFVKSGEVMLLAAGLSLVLIIPFLQFRGLGKVKRWSDERRSGTKQKEPLAG